MRYTAFFCEENVWHLARERADGHEAHVVFVTNRDRRVALWKQRAGDPVVWDYHVVLLDGGTVVDLDTVIDGAPSVPVSTWIAETFRPVPEAFAPWFRVVDAGDFLRTFASDRSHMRDARGMPLQPFPPWDPIRCELGAHTLPRFLDRDDEIAGEWLDLTGFRRRFASAAPDGPQRPDQSHVKK